MTLAAWDTSRSTYLFISTSWAHTTKRSAPPSAPSRSVRPVGTQPCKCWRTLHLGIVYQTQADYRRAIDCLSQTLTTVDGHERFGEYILAVFAPAYLAACHAELGTFAEGRFVADEGLRIAEAVDHPMSLTFALWGCGLLALRQGDLSRAVTLLDRAVRLCQDMGRPASFPLMAAALGATYNLAGRTTDAMLLLAPLLEQAIASEVGVNQATCSLTL